MSSALASTLSPLDRASFATLSRLLSCLVTESLLKAIFVPIGPTPQEYLIGAAIVLNPLASQHETPYMLEDVFAVVPLRHIPIFKSRSDTEIGLLDPLDMLPCVFEPIHDVKASPSHRYSTQVCRYN